MSVPVHKVPPVKERLRPTTEGQPHRLTVVPLTMYWWSPVRLVTAGREISAAP
jgi:hypothetical protein